MIRTIIWFIYFWLYLVYLTPRLLKVKKLDKAGNIEERDKIINETAFKWAQSLLKMAGVTIKVTGTDNVPLNEPVVFVSNHQGNFDIPILLASIEKPKAFIAKTELANLPLISSWMKYMHCVFIDRSDIRQSLKVISQASDYIKEGYSMSIFPEGTRSRGKDMGEFKPGSMKLALKSQATIVPVAIRGSYKIMEENGFLIKPGLVEVVIVEPIPTKDLTKEQARDLPELVQKIIQSELQK
ncbi:MAG: acyl-phosphate glycerol 3-phosphate acyltransferase [Gracilibacter sp. BRH_c7a]|nr:MAG: acyl-phosphate glycerol 3-phosphate acyltransferase [Gracilibacter sp. BRH_c7a]